MEEFVVRAASSTNKKLSLLKFHKDDKFTWNDVKVRKEGDHHPWQLKVGSGKSARRFRAVKEGGVSDNASYFVFFKSPDANQPTFEVCPIEEWYNVSATLRYKALSAEEAEKKYEQRHKMLNLFSVMHLKNKDGESLEEGSNIDKKGGFKVSELDDWQDSDRPDDEEESGDEANNKKNSKSKKNKNKKKGSDDDEPKLNEAGEESDEGDFEHREVDYMSDSSSSSDEGEGDKAEIKAISEETAMRDLLLSEGEDEDEIKKESQDGNENSNEGEKGAEANEETKIKQEPDPDSDRSMSGGSDDSDDSDIDESKINSVVFMKKVNIKQEPDLTSANGSKLQPSTSVAATNKANNGRPSQKAPTTSPPPSELDRSNLKRKTSTDSRGSVKRPCPTDSQSAAGSTQDGSIEDLVRRYLMRKPMTAKALLRQLRAKKRWSGSKDLEVAKIAEVINKLNVVKQMVNNELLLYIR